MHLPTINYIEISSFPLSGPTSCDNLHQLNIYAGRENGSLEIVQPEKMFREFRIFYSALVTTKLLMLNCKLADQLSTSWILDDSRCLSFGLKMNRSRTSFPRCTHFEGTWFDGPISFFGVFRGFRGIGSDGGTKYAGSPVLRSQGSRPRDRISLDPYSKKWRRYWSNLGVLPWDRFLLKSLVRIGWAGRNLRRNDLYPINISATIQYQSPLLSTILLRVAWRRFAKCGRVILLHNSSEHHF